MAKKKTKKTVKKTVKKTAKKKSAPKAKLLIVDEEKRDGKIVFVATGYGKEIVMDTNKHVDDFIEKVKDEIEISDRRTVVL